MAAVNKSFFQRYETDIPLDILFDCLFEGLLTPPTSPQTVQNTQDISGSSCSEPPTHQSVAEQPWPEPPSDLFTYGKAPRVYRQLTMGAQELEQDLEMLSHTISTTSVQVWTESSHLLNTS